MQRFIIITIKVNWFNTVIYIKSKDHFIIEVDYSNKATDLIRLASKKEVIYFIVDKDN